MFFILIGPRPHAGVAYGDRGIELFGVNTDQPTTTPNVYRQTYSIADGWSSWEPLGQTWLG